MENKKIKIEKILNEIKPYIKAHKGDVELVEVKGKTVTLKISGACVGCPLANLTYNKLRDIIKEKIPEVEEVVFKKY